MRLMPMSSSHDVEIIADSQTPSVTYSLVNQPVIAVPVTASKFRARCTRYDIDVAMSHLRVEGITPVGITPSFKDMAGLVCKRVEGSGFSVKDPKIMWLVCPTRSPERNQAITDVAREIAHYAKQRYIWIRSLDHSTSTVYDLDYEKLDSDGEPTKKPRAVPDHPHITVYTSCDPDFVQLEGLAYLTYSEGSIIGLANEEELGDKYKGQNPLLAVYRSGVEVTLEEPPSRMFRERRPPPEKPREFPWWRR